jgi:hypothetical protein
MNGKKIIGLLVAMMMVTAISVAVTPVSAVMPPAPGSTYIQDVRVGNLNDPLNYNSGGVRIKLTATGDNVGVWWDGAWGISYFTIESWESQTGKSWPYQWRSRESVTWEIMWHCRCPWIDTTQRYTTISFNDGWFWD